MDKLIQRLATAGIQVIVDGEARSYISRRGYEPQYGARPIKRAVQTYLEDELSEMLIEESIHEGQHIRVAYDNASDKLLYTKEDSML